MGVGSKPEGPELLAGLSGGLSVATDPVGLRQSTLIYPW